MYLWTNVQWAAWFFQQLNVHGLRQARSWRFQRANTYTLTSTKWLNDKTRKNGNYPATRPILFEMTFCSVLWPKKHQMARFGCRGQGTTVHTVSDFMTFIPGQSVWISFFLQFRVLCSPPPTPGVTGQHLTDSEGKTTNRNHTRRKQEDKPLHCVSCVYFVVVVTALITTPLCQSYTESLL